MLATPALWTATNRIETALHRNKAARMISPVDVQLILALLPILLGSFGCLNAADDADEEERAYRFVTGRPWWQIFDRRGRMIRSAVSRKWLDVGGDEFLAGTVGNSIEEETRSLSREFFHNLWAEAKDIRRGYAKPPQRYRDES